MWSNKQLHCLRFMESLNITCQVIWNLRQRWELKMQMRCLMFGGLDVFAIFFGQSCIDTLCCASLLASLIIGLSWAGLRILLFRIVDTSMFVKSRTHGPSTGRRLLIQDSARQKGSALDQKALQSWLPKLLETTFVSLFIVTKIYFNFFFSRENWLLHLQNNMKLISTSGLCCRGSCSLGDAARGSRGFQTGSDLQREANFGPKDSKLGSDGWVDWIGRAFLVSKKDWEVRWVLEKENTVI